MPGYLKHLIALFISFSLLVSSFASVRAEQEKKFIAMIGDDGAQRVDLLAGKYFFNPNYIVVKVNVPVEIKMRKEPGIVPHNMVINEPEADIEVKESIGTEPKIIRFTPTKTGKYPFFCNKKLLFFKSHREKGMEGIIEVVP